MRENTENRFNNNMKIRKNCEPKSGWEFYTSTRLYNSGIMGSKWSTKSTFGLIALPRNHVLAARATA